jgi:hypothetical protein
MIVWLASYPRSGNTLLRMAFYHLCKIKTYSVYNDPLFVNEGMSEIMGHEILPAPIEELAARKGTYLVKTHARSAGKDAAVCMVRDGRDVMVSLAKYNMAFAHPSKAGKLDFHQLMHDIVTASEGNDHWGEHILDWAESGAVVVRYEDFVAEPEARLRGILRDLNLNLQVSGRLPDFGELHATWPKFFRKGEAGTWRGEFPDDLLDPFWENHGEAMRRFGYA